MSCVDEQDLLAKIIWETIGPLTPEILAALPDISLNTSESSDKCLTEDKENFRPDEDTSKISFNDIFRTDNTVSGKRPSTKRKDNHHEESKCKKVKGKSMSDEEKRRIQSSLPSYELKRILQKHSRRADPKDFKTPIWDIKFKPNGRNYNSNHIAATVGGNYVNIIDLKSGHVVGRYEDKDPNETFNCMAWRDFVDQSIICVGGTIKDYRDKTYIVFFNADNPNDYFRVAAHSLSINKLEFHPIIKNRLFSGSYDKKIIVWSLVWQNFRQDSPLSAIKVNKIIEVDCNNRVLNIVIAPKLDFMVVTGEDGIVLFKEPKTSSDVVKVVSVDLSSDCRLVDGLVLVGKDSNLIAFRHTKWIIVADLQVMVDFTKKIDFKGVVPLIVVNRLQYCSLKCDYFYMSVESRLLCCGDAYGRVLIYYLKDFILKANDKENPIEAMRTLPKPDLTNLPIKRDPKTGKPAMKDLLINIAAISPNHEYIVCGTNSNLICVWRRRDPMPMHSTPKPDSILSQKSNQKSNS